MSSVVIILVVLILALVLKRTFSSFIYSLAIVDIFLRILHFIKLNVINAELGSILSRYFPTSLFNLVDSYTSGIFHLILTWFLVIAYIIFEYYIVCTFFRKK